MFELEEVRTWERNPQFYADMLASSLAGQALFTHAPARRARAPRPVEAAADAAPDPGRARQHQGAARHLRQGRHRDDARRAEVHRRGSAARVLRRRRPAPARRSRRRADRKPSQARRRATSSTSKTNSRRRRARRSASAATSSSRSCGSKRASRCRSIGCWRSPTRELNDDAGSVPVARRQDERRRSAGGVGEDEGAASGARRAGRRSAASSSTSSRPSSSASRLDHAAGRRADHGRADARVLPLVVREHVDAGPVREQADARVLLPHRRRSVVAGRSAGRAPARLQLPDALVDLDPRGLSRATSCTTSTCGGWSRRRASRSCSRRRRSSKAGRTTASR